MASLTITTGPHAGDYYPLGRRTLVIGRDEGCPAQIVDDQISRKHAQVRWADGRYVVLDMKSANGTLVNGRPLTGELELAEGDEITVGNSRLMFSEQDFPDRESALAHWRRRGQRDRSTLMP
ncbi:MAG: FHA domain-containing protein [Planctomycetia bacterium]|nr:FHA domain-containing protein [Planctomycetia bacterium]MCK6486625.1 FHA domain-containing protein [Phycisphaerae bacterium]